MQIVRDSICDSEPLETCLGTAATKIVHDEACGHIKLGIKVQSVAHDAYIRALELANIDKAGE